MMMSGYPQDSGHCYIQAAATHQHQGHVSACKGNTRYDYDTKGKKGKGDGVILIGKTFDF